MFFILSTISFIGCNTKLDNLNNSNLGKADSIFVWIQQSKNKSFDLEYRKECLLKAYYYNNQNNDSIKNNNLLKIAFEAYNLNDTILFKKTNLEAFILSKKLFDNFGIADTHWNFGNYYSDREIMDSAYYYYSKAYNNFEVIDHQYFAGKMLYNMAIIQKNIKDYTGSEILAFQAISIFKKLNKNENLYLCYNLLGTIFNQIQEYDKAIMYHNIAIELSEKTEKKGTKREISLNNLGMVYQELDSNKMAIVYFNKALENDNLINENINLYARLIDNRAYTKFLAGDTINVLQDYNTSLHIRDSINYISGIITSKLHLAKYYAKYLDTPKAISNATEANILAKTANGNRDVLVSLLLLSQLDANNASTYFKNYVTLSDSLQIQERQIRNKFTRIRFETDEYIAENEKISQQKLLISIGSAVALLILSLLYFIRVQRTKNKELHYEKEQQKANEEIYSLMLKQQSTLEEGRLKERQRISEDLHDGVLGKIFGTRLALGFLNIKGDSDTITKHKFYVDDLQNIEKEIRTISHELKNEILSSQTDFIKIVENLLINQSEIGNFKFEIINTKVGWDKIDDRIKINVYRIIQEAIQNIHKYSKAKNVKIEFDLIKDSIFLYIIDDGVGFDVNLRSKGIGLRNMKSRVQKLNGTFDLKSVKNKGTTVSISIPI
ncbi:MAG: tetratricopeptide repeat-containing sensor histidine kinase [Lutibacter sp.]